jgi:uncharacterized protein (DUF305 family)
MNKLTPIFIAGALAISAGLAFAQSQMNTPEPTSSHAGHSMSTPAPDADGPSTSAYRVVNDKMHAEMAIEFTGNADIDFMKGMIPHHQGAIDMARVVLEHGEDPEVRKLAEEVIAAQKGEIAMMKQWLAAHGQ